jgi:hypothetical protein
MIKRIYFHLFAIEENNERWCKSDHDSQIKREKMSRDLE